MDLVSVVERFGGGKEEKPGQWVVHCPAHDDGSPSLAITMGAKGVVLACRAGCDNAAIIAAVGLKWSDLFMDEPKAKRRITAVYAYTDETGLELYQKVRFEPKGFFQRRKAREGESSKDGFITNLEGVRQVPYHLPQLLADKRRMVFVVEGEKDVHSLETLGCVATTNPGGAGKWRDDFNRFFAGRVVTILPDNDEPGRTHAALVKAALEKVAKKVEIVELPNLPPKGDVSDWIAAGGTAEQLRKLIQKPAEEPCNSPSTTPKESPNSSGTDCTASSTPEPQLPTPSPEEAKPEELALLTALKLCRGKYSQVAADLIAKEVKGC